MDGQEGPATAGGASDSELSAGLSRNFFLFGNKSEQDHQESQSWPSE